VPLPPCSSQSITITRRAGSTCASSARPFSGQNPLPASGNAWWKPRATFIAMPVRHATSAAASWPPSIASAASRTAGDQRMPWRDAIGSSPRRNACRYSASCNPARRAGSIGAGRIGVTRRRRSSFDAVVSSRASSGMSAGA
jgi:hypothetical protein